MKVVATIPARLASQRIARKSLRLVNGERPLVSYAIRAALAAGTIDDVYVNSESEEIGAIGCALGARFYPRRSDLAGDAVSLDEITYDFMKHIDADLVVMVNPATPLVTARDIDASVAHFRTHALDTLIPVRDEQLHAFCEPEALGREPGEPSKDFCGHVPVNFDASGKLPRTQDSARLRICVWSVCVWRRETFMRSFEATGAGVLSGRVGFFPQAPSAAFQVGSEEELRLAEILLRDVEQARDARIPHDSEQKLGPDAPAMWLAEIEYIESALLEEGRRRGSLRIVDWGARSGTLHFAKRLREHGIPFHWDAVENYRPAHARLAQRIQAAGLGSQVELHLCNGTFEDRRALQESAEMREYVELPLHLGCAYDVALLDGCQREACLETAARVLKPDGLALLRDAESIAARGAFRSYRGGGEVAVESPAPVPGGLQKLWAGRPVGS